MHHVLQHIRAQGRISPERKKAELLNQLKSFIENPAKTADFYQAKQLIDKIFDKQTLTFEVSIGAASNLYFLVNAVPDTKRDDWKPFCDGIIGLLHDIGYRQDISTQQEHRLVPSTIWEGYTPHVPTGILEGNLSVGDARKARELELMVFVDSKQYGLPNETRIPILLEPLNDEGKTVRDPRPIDGKKLKEFLRKNVLTEEAIGAFLLPGCVKSSAFPYPRN